MKQHLQTRLDLLTANRRLLCEVHKELVEHNSRLIPECEGLIKQADDNIKQTQLKLQEQ